jgi:hypothetical protein
MRREFLGLLTSFGVAVGAAESEPCALQELDLPPDVSADLLRSAQSSLRAADALKELPLDGIPPCFIFTPK